MIPRKAVVESQVDEKQALIDSLNAKVRSLQDENAMLRKEMEAAERRRGLASTTSWVDESLLSVIEGMDEQFATIGSYLDQSVAPNVAILPGQSRSVKFEGDLMARIEALMRYKERSNQDEFNAAVKLLIGGYFKDGLAQQELENFVINADRDTVASAIASRLSYKNADKGVEAIVYAYCKAAIMNTNIITASTDEVVDATKVKYNYNVQDQVNISPVVSHDANVPAGQLDHIYNKHHLDKSTITLLHALSHVDDTIKGDGLSLYHVGTATRFAECSVLYVDGTPFKPFRVMKEYAIIPTLPNEYHGRVEAMISIFGGLSPITLVRVYNTGEMPQGLIVGAIAHVVNSLLANTILYTCDVNFSPYGIYIQATGNTDSSSHTKIDCCQASFGRAPGMERWNQPRHQGYHYFNNPRYQGSSKNYARIGSYLDKTYGTARKY